MGEPQSLKIRLSDTRACRVGAALIVTAGLSLAGAGPAQAVFNHPTYSSPIAISGDNKLVWSVNPAGKSVSVIRTDTNAVIQTITVGTEPQNVALDPGNKFAYVANTADNSVTVIQITNPNPASFSASVLGSPLITGAEPWNLVTSPDGKRVFVANSGQDTITVIDPNAVGGPSIIGNVDLRNSLCNDPDRNRHFQPRGLAVTLDNTKLYVARFLSFIKTDGVQGVDTGREGIICRLDINTSSSSIGNYQPAAVISLGPQIVGSNGVGFQFPGLNEDTLCFPNQMQSIVIRGDQAYLPNICASPSDPLRFNVDTEAFVSIIDNVNEANQTDASLTKFFLGGGTPPLGPNLHLGARMPEDSKQILFFPNPWGIAFTNQSGDGLGYAISAGSDLLVKVIVAADGTLSFTGG